MSYGIWCECNGMVGRREAWLRTDDGIQTWDEKSKAQDEATRLNATMNHANSHASFRYTAQEF